MKNLFGKTVDKDKPYAVYVNRASGFEWRVLKTYQTPANEKKNPYARWLMAVKSPLTYNRFELGDVYIKDVLDGAILTECTHEWAETYGYKKMGMTVKE